MTSDTAWMQTRSSVKACESSPMRMRITEQNGSVFCLVWHCLCLLCLSQSVCARRKLKQGKKGKQINEGSFQEHRNNKWNNPGRHTTVYWGNDKKIKQEETKKVK